MPQMNDWRFRDLVSTNPDVKARSSRLLRFYTTHVAGLHLKDCNHTKMPSSQNQRIYITIRARLGRVQSAARQSKRPEHIYNLQDQK